MAKIGHLQSELAVTFGRNNRSRSIGISGQNGPEYAMKFRVGKIDVDIWIIARIALVISSAISAWLALPRSTQARISLIVWFPLAGCVARHAPTIAEQCAIYPAIEWTKLSAPPAEAGQLLKLAFDGRIAAAKESKSEVWFRSDTGTLRYCRYTRSADPCDGPEYVDFQFYFNKWNASGGLTGICVNADHR